MLLGDDGDTLYVVADDRLVVADIDIQPQDSIDSVWVKVARDQLTQGWVSGERAAEARVARRPHI